MNQSGPKLLAIDATGIIHRMFRAVEKSSKDPARPEALGLIEARIRELLSTHRPDSAMAAFDVPEAWTWRHDRHAGYKASRPPKDEHLVPLMRQTWRMCTQMGIVAAADSGAEADDILAEAAKRWERGPVIVAARDKDLFSLIREGVSIYDPTDRCFREADYVRKRFRVEPQQMSSYLALVGDPTDDVPGVAGIGAVAAARLLSAHNDWPEVRAAAETHEGTDYAKVRAGRVMGDLSYELTGFAVTRAIPAFGGRPTLAPQRAAQGHAQAGAGHRRAPPQESHAPG